jgi:NAD(P)-dependent dehydrogenase (short-subunit alcohol dehydrogenase family)
MTTPDVTLAQATVAVVVGASGGIGGALVEALRSSGWCSVILALSRRGGQPLGGHDVGLQPPHGASPGKPGDTPDTTGCRVLHAAIDVTDEASVDAAAAQAQGLGDVRWVIVASGVLHSPGRRPEKSWSSIDAQHMLDVYAINTVGPALVAKHFLPLLPRQGRSVFAALSARVGSIGDNRVGGWTTYRASKAALNMVIKTLSVELARRAPEALCIGLHPGTVDTALSKNFQGSVAPGKLFTPTLAATQLLEVLNRLTPEHNGSVLAWDGAVVLP